MTEALKMFEFGPLREVTRARKNPTTTMWVDRVKNDDEGHEFVRSRPVARVLEPRHEGPRNDLCAAMPLLKANQA